MASFDDPLAPQARRIGRYEVLGEIASGGMATVFLAKSMGAKGFSRLVAIKRLHPHLEGEEEFVQMFLDEARLAARIRHPHVVATLDVEDQDGLYIVMEYIEGVTLLTLSRMATKMGDKVPVPVASRIALDILGGLQAAHDLVDDNGDFLNLVHRDVSPQNILLGTDGAARLTDFGIAKAGSRLTQTRDGQLKGKISYMAPEQTRRQEIDRRVDLFAMGIILWEVFAGRRLFQGDSDVEVLNHLLFEPIPRLKDAAPSVPASLEQVVMKALERDPANRFSSAHEFADAIERATKVVGGPGNHRAVAAYMQKICGERIQRERGRIANGLPPTAEGASTGSFKALDLPLSAAPSQVRSQSGPASMPPPGQKFRPPTMVGVPVQRAAPAPAPAPAPKPAPRAANAGPTKLPLRATVAAPVTPPPARPAKPTVMGMGPESRPPPAAPVALTFEQDFDEEMATMAVAPGSPHESWLKGEAASTAPDFDPPADANATIMEAAPMDVIMERLRISGVPGSAPDATLEADIEDDIEEIQPEPSGAFDRGQMAAALAPSPMRYESGPSPVRAAPTPQRYPSGPSPMQTAPMPQQQYPSYPPTAQGPGGMQPSFAPLPPTQGSGVLGPAYTAPFGPLNGPPPQQGWSLGGEVPPPPPSAVATAAHRASPGSERRNNLLAFAFGMIIVAALGAAGILWMISRNPPPPVAPPAPAVVRPVPVPVVVPPAPAPAPVVVAPPAPAPAVVAPAPAPVPAVVAPAPAPAPAPVPVIIEPPTPAPAPTPAVVAAPPPAEEPGGRRRRRRRRDDDAPEVTAPVPVLGTPTAPVRVVPVAPPPPDPDAPDLGNPYQR